MPSPGDPPFRSVAIIGLGLIGGSIALAVRERWPAVRVIGVDRKPVLAHALTSGAVDRGGEDLSTVESADLVILAAPVSQNVRLVGELASCISTETLVTDVGGTKRDIVRAARGSAVGSRFVGGHPLGGAERGGFGFARPDLFKGRPWIFTPDASSRGEIVQQLFGFARGLGAKPSTLSAEEHDRIMAFVSHLPQLTASALMQAIGSAVHADGLRLAGRGLIDTTRLASSPADTWRDICAANADALRGALDSLIGRLTELRDDLTDGAAIQRVFDEAARKRAELMAGGEMTRD